MEENKNNSQDINKSDLQDINKNLIKLTEKIRKLTSPWWSFLRGIATGVGTAIGATIVAAIVLTILTGVINSTENVPILNSIIEGLNITSMLEKK